jgi:hypothetical protein
MSSFEPDETNILWCRTYFGSREKQQNMKSLHLGFEQTIDIFVEKARRSHGAEIILFELEADANKVLV